MVLPISKELSSSDICWRCLVASMDLNFFPPSLFKSGILSFGGFLRERVCNSRVLQFCFTTPPGIGDERLGISSESLLFILS